MLFAGEEEEEIDGWMNEWMNEYIDEEHNMEKITTTKNAIYKIHICSCFLWSLEACLMSPPITKATTISLPAVI